MRTRQFLLAISMLTIALTAIAQSGVEARLKVIRDAYEARLGMMTNQPYDDGVEVEQLTVNYNRMYPGTGLYRHTDTYYWTDDENEEYMLLPQLYFVTKRYTMNSGIYRYYREYLFDVETGEPMFLLIATQLGDDVGTKKEYRFYFDQGKLIKQIPERIVVDENDLLTLDFEVDDNGRAGNLIPAFNSVKETFGAIVPTYAW